MATLINATAHELLQEQQEYFNNHGFDVIINLKDYCERGNNPLFNELINCPSDKGQLERLANELFNICQHYTGVHLPIGSPAFQYIFNQLCIHKKFKAFFSHSERKSVEVSLPNGVVGKQSVFQFITTIDF